jgi:hypothetical protein
MLYFIRRFLIFLIPLGIIIATYFILDPFRVLYDYDDYYKNLFYQINREQVSFSTYNNHKKIRQYDSFIFGSSRTLAYKTYDWQNSLKGRSISPFVFDASNETINGIFSKINYLNEQDAPIKNAIIIICTDVTFSKDTSERYDYLYIKHPKLSENGYLRYHFKFLTTYLQNGFFIKYLDYKIFKVYRSYMSNFFDKRNASYDHLTNDLFINGRENEIERDSVGYYENYKWVFYDRKDSATFCSEQISNVQLSILTKIAKIFAINSTDYKIIIGPLYDQKKINPSDLNKLDTVFGTQNVFDYSGRNDFTNNKHNYLENSHYRYRVGRQILFEIYHKSQNIN